MKGLVILVKHTIANASVMSMFKRLCQVKVKQPADCPDLVTSLDAPAQKIVDKIKPAAFVKHLAQHTVTGYSARTLENSYEI